MANEVKTPKFVASEINPTQPRATFAQLNSGGWGVTVQDVAAPTPGTKLQVKKRDGHHVEVTIARAVRVQGWGWLCEIEAAPRESSGPPKKSGGRAEPKHETADRCRGCKGPIRHAKHHRAMGGYCGSCAHDEYDM